MQQTQQTPLRNPDLHQTVHKNEQRQTIPALQRNSAGTVHRPNPNYGNSHGRVLRREEV